MSDDRTYMHSNFDKLFNKAYQEFLDREYHNGAPDHNPAVKAARLNQFIMEHYPILVQSVTPDICERYMERYPYRAGPIDREPEIPLNEAQRYAEARLVYQEFREDFPLQGSKEAEIIAFHDYVHRRYPHTLPGFSEEEAEQAMARDSHEKDRASRAKSLMTTICAITLACSFMSFIQKAERAKSPTTPSPRSRTRTEDPQPGPAISPQDFHKPFMPESPNSPSYLPMIGPPMPYETQRWPERNWQERYWQPPESEGKDDERKR